MRAFLLLLLTCVLCYSCSNEERGGFAMSGLQDTKRVTLESLNEVIEDNPVSEEALYRRAKIHFENSKSDLALKDVDQALFIQADNPDYLFLKSKILLKIGDLEEAKTTAETAAVAGYESSLFYNHLSKIYLETDSIDLAIEYNSAAIKMVPDLAEALLMKGQLSLKKGEYQDAISAFEKSLILNDKDPNTYEFMGKAYIEIGELDSAVRFTERGFQINSSKDNTGLWINRGKVMEALGKLDSALRVYDRILRLDQSNGEVNEDKGRVLEKKGSFRAAYNSYQLVLAQSPKEKSIYLRAGYCLERLFAYKEAQELYLRAKTNFPEEEEFLLAYNRMTAKVEGQYRNTNI